MQHDRLKRSHAQLHDDVVIMRIQLKNEQDITAALRKRIASMIDAPAEGDVYIPAAEYVKFPKGEVPHGYVKAEKYEKLRAELKRFVELYHKCKHIIDEPVEHHKAPDSLKAYREANH